MAIYAYIIGELIENNLVNAAAKFWPSCIPSLLGIYPFLQTITKLVDLCIFWFSLSSGQGNFHSKYPSMWMHVTSSILPKSKLDPTVYFLLFAQHHVHA